MNIEDEYKKWEEEQISKGMQSGWKEYAEYLHSKLDILERHIGHTIKFLIENKEILGLDEHLFTGKQTKPLPIQPWKLTNKKVNPFDVVGLKNTLIFDEIDCIGNCENCTYRDGTCCQVSSRFGSEKPSSKQIKFAESIAHHLNIALPICKKKIPYGAFISANRENFEYKRATRVWQTDF